VAQTATLVPSVDSRPATENAHPGVTGVPLTDVPAQPSAQGRCRSSVRTASGPHEQDFSLTS
jgi:hypothetical protein